MSSPRGLARTYLKYWYKDTNGVWQLADNAPVAVKVCVRTMPATVTKNMAYEAFSIVGGYPAAERPTAAILAWFQSHPQVMAHCDNALRSKRPPATFAELVGRAYSAELLTARNHVTTYLEREILI